MADAIPRPLMDSRGLASAFARGTLWSVGLRWGLKLIGLVSTLVLARLLVPEDFGIVAIAMIFVSLIEMIFSLGSDAVVLRDANASPDLIDSAWTLKVLEGVAAAVLIAALSPLAASFFAEPRLVPVLLVLCVGVVIQGFTSFGPLLARKELDFGLEVRLAMGAKVVTFMVTMAIAFWQRNYWALVIGTMLGYASGCIMSYSFHPYRSRFTLSRLREIWGFSQWMMVSSIGSFFTRKTDDFLVARIASAADLGLYSVASDLGQTVSAELSVPINRASLPVLAQIDPASPRLASVVAMTLAASNTLILPAGFGLAAVSEHAVAVVLGPKWASTAPLLTMFSIAWALRYMPGLYSVVAMLKGKPNLLGVLTWTEAGVVMVLGVSLMRYGVEGIAWARCGAAAAALLMWLAIGPRIGMSLSIFLGATWRPLCGAVLMFAVLRLLPGQFEALAPFFDLAARIVIGAVIYTVWILATWLLLRRPDGLEARALAAAKLLLARVRRGA